MNIEEFIQKMRRKLLTREERVRAHIGARFEATLSELTATLARGSRDSLNVARQQVLARQIEDALTRLQFEAMPLIENEKRAERIAASRDFGRIMGQYDIKVGIDPIAIERIGGALEQGTPLSRLLSRLAGTTGDSARQELFTSVALGENPRLTARRLRRVMHASRWRAETIARTEVLRAYRGSMRERMRETDEVVRYRWISARGTRTCAMCWALHGREFNLGEAFATHPNCRCSQAPVPRNTLIEIASGEEVFSTLSSANQRTILGPAKYNAYRDGALQLSDLVGTAQSADWGKVRFERSLTAVLGDRARQYIGRAS